MKTSPLICRANQWTGFYMITAPVMKELSMFSFGKQLLIYRSSHPEVLLEVCDFKKLL